MCGISGFINKKNAWVGNCTDALKDMVYFNRLRGLDALGFFKVKSNGDYDLIKDVGDPANLLGYPNFKNFIINAGDNKFFVQHNRHATRGEKKAQACAHPFLVHKEGSDDDVIIMVHNGTLTYIKNEEKFPGRTDSHSLAKMLAAGVPIKEIEENVWGAYAVVWYDSEDQTMNFVRNKERPFGFVHSDDTIWFGSELYLVGAAAERNTIKVNSFERLPVMEHWKWHHADKKFEKISIPIKTTVLGSAHFYDNESEFCDSGAFECDIAEESLRGLPKSSTLGGTTVVPYKQQTLLPAANQGGYGDTRVAPQVSKPRTTTYTHQGKKRKLHWILVSNAIGMSRGDVLCFSLVNYTATPRTLQTALEGRMVATHEDGRLSQLGHVQVDGMLPEMISVVDRTNHLWKGIVTAVYMAKVGDSVKSDYIYRFCVKDVTPHQPENPDPFREWNKLGSYNEVTHQERAEALKKLPTGTQGKAGLSGLRLIEEREFADYAPLSLKCESCSIFHKRNLLTKLQKGEGADAVSIELCRQCLETCMADNSRLDILFANAEFAQALDDGPIYDPTDELPLVH